MANISHFTQTINGVSTTYDIHDANAVDLTSNQTVGGIKTFSNAPVVGSINLDGKTIDTDANGNMTYDSHIVDTIEEQGEGYIRYSSGLQICWGAFGGVPTTAKNITFQKPFVAGKNSITFVGQNGPIVTQLAGLNPAYFVVSATADIDTGHFFAWQAIGKWK